LSTYILWLKIRNVKSGSSLGKYQEGLRERRGESDSLLFLKNSVALDKTCLLWYNIST